MELTKQDIEKINNLTRVLGNALRDIQELAAKVEDGGGQIPEPKRRNLKQERKDKYREMFESGKMRRRKH